MSLDLDDVDPIVKAILCALSQFNCNDAYKVEALDSVSAFLREAAELEDQMGQEAECVLTAGGMVLIKVRDKTNCSFYGESR